MVLKKYDFIKLWPKISDFSFLNEFKTNSCTTIYKAFVKIDRKKLKKGLLRRSILLCYKQKIFRPKTCSGLKYKSKHTRPFIKAVCSKWHCTKSYLCRLVWSLWIAALARPSQTCPRPGPSLEEFQHTAHSGARGVLRTAGETAKRTAEKMVGPPGYPTYERINADNITAVLSSPPTHRLVLTLSLICKFTIFRVMPFCLSGRMRRKVLVILLSPLSRHFFFLSYVLRMY